MMEAARKIAIKEQHQPDMTNAAKHNREATNRLSLRFLSRNENVSMARLLTAALAAERELTVAELDEIKVAVSEAVSNAIVHGYQGRPDCYVELDLALTPSQLIVVVHDDGVGIENIEQAIKPSFSTAGGERMGLGFAFMHSFMDAVDVQSLPGEGTTVTLYKNLP